MEWWHIVIGVLAIPVLWFLKTLIEFARLSPEERQAVDRRAEEQKQRERYVDEVAAAMRRMDALAQYPSQAGDRAFRNRAAIWRFQETFERMAIPQGFEEAHYTLLRYFEQLLREWDDDPLGLSNPTQLRNQSLAEREALISEMESALADSDMRYKQEVVAFFTEKEARSRR